MPKLAKEYDDRYYSDFRVSSNLSVSNTYLNDYSYGSMANQRQPLRRKRTKNKRKKDYYNRLLRWGFWL